MAWSASSFAARCPRVAPPGRRRAAGVLAAVLLAGCPTSDGDDGAAAPPPRVRTRAIAQGPLVSEVTPERAILWARGEGPGSLRVVLDGGGRRHRARRALSRDADHVAKIRFTGLTPGADHAYRAWIVAPDEEDAAGFRPPEGDPNLVQGTFTTPPPPDEPRAVTFAFGGDLAGQNVCRDEERGFPVFDAVADADPAFFLALGDMIYADYPCWFVGKYLNEQVRGPKTPATSLADYRRIWAYTRSDPTFRKLLRRTVYVAGWDDHEFVNDVSPGNDVLPEHAAGVHLFPLGRRAFREQHPIVAAPGAGQGIYRSFRWGAHLETFILDTRTFRAPNDQPDTGEAPKSMLGDAQRRWLVDGLTGSDATWKVVATSVPLSIPTGDEGARDGWADDDGETGFERELVGILRALAEAGVANLVFLTADVHFATVFRYRPFPEDHPEFRFHEVVVGPLSAGLFPRQALDETLDPERRFFLGPDEPEALESFLQALPWMTFGRAEITERGVLDLAVVSADGTVRYAFPLIPELPDEPAAAAGEPVAGPPPGGEAPPSATAPTPE